MAMGSERRSTRGI